MQTLMATQVIRNACEASLSRSDPDHQLDHAMAWNGIGSTAIRPPRFAAFESAMAGMLRALAQYADAHQAAFGSRLADDCVLGEAWESQLRGFVVLLNGECGRLDCGALDSAARALYAHAGFEGEL